MQRMGLAYEVVRDMVMEALGEQGCVSETFLFAHVPIIARRRELVPPLPSSYNQTEQNADLSLDRLGLLDQLMVKDIVWDLIVEGILRPGAYRMQPYLPDFHLTELGRSVIAGAEASPYNPSGYLQTLRREITNLDDIIVNYVNESLKSLRGGCYLASVVTMGAAAEKAMLLLYDAVVNYMPEAQRNAFSEPLKKKMIKVKFDAIRAKLRGDIGEHLPDDIKDRLLVDLDSLFELIRVYRNDAGHPTGANFYREQVHSNLNSLKHFLTKIYQVINWLDGHPQAAPASTPSQGT